MRVLALAVLWAIAGCAAGRPEHSPAPFKEKPYGVDERFERAERFLHGRSYGLARGEVRELERALPDGVPRRMELYELKGRLALLESGCGAAKPFFLEAIKLAASLDRRDPYAAASGLALGRCYRREGGAELARRVLEKALKDGPHEATKLAIEEELQALSAPAEAP